MGEAVKYDPELFLFERAQAVSSRIGEFLIGLSRIGAATETDWVPLEMASFSTTYNYGVQDGILIVDAETASVSMSYRTEADEWAEKYPLYSGDRVRASYDGKVVFLGTVDKIDVRYSADPSAKPYGKVRTITFAADMLGTHAAMMGRMICPGRLPAESAYNRIRRWVTVTGW